MRILLVMLLFMGFTHTSQVSAEQVQSSFHTEKAKKEEQSLKGSLLEHIKHAHKVPDFLIWNLKIMERWDQGDSAYVCGTYRMGLREYVFLERMNKNIQGGWDQGGLNLDEVKELWLPPIHSRPLDFALTNVESDVVVLKGIVRDKSIKKVKALVGKKEVGEFPVVDNQFFFGMLHLNENEWKQVIVEGINPADQVIYRGKETDGEFVR